jgi:hypothetical protein
MKMTNIVELKVDSRLDIKAENVLKGALDANLQTVVLIGYDEDGNIYMASSYGHIEDTNMLVDVAKKEVMELWSSRND